MQGSKKIPIINLNQHITCKICNGYFVDATTIIECLHTFCRSCIVKYLQSNKYCPVCDVQVHKTKPLLNIRPDKTLQEIVYKLVPRLFQNEMHRRRDFYDSHPEAKPSSVEQCGEASYQHLLAPEETICLTLSYHGCSNMPRYLRCPAAVSVNHLKKLIRAKYDLTNNHRVEILYNQDCLSSSLTLIDVAYIYLWKRKGPLELTYRIYECTAKKPKLEPETAPASANNNNNWKEVQLRISENGEMSITGIQDGALSPSLLEIVNSDQKYKNDVTVVEKPTKKELPGLKYIGKSPNAASITTAKPRTEDPKTPESTVQDALRLQSDINVPGFITSCATLSSATTTTVFSTINSSKCSTKSDDAPVRVETPAKTEEDAKPPAVVNNNVADKGVKRKIDSGTEAEPVNKQPKPTILNHSIGLLNLSNNHPLKKHSKLNRNGDNTKNCVSEPDGTPPATTKTVTTNTNTKTGDATFSKPSFLNKNFTVHQNRPGTPITTTKPSILPTKPSIIPLKAPPTYTGTKSPCYMPKTTYNPVITVPKPVPSCLKPDKLQPSPVTSIKTTAGTSSYTVTKVDSKPGVPLSSQQQQIANLNNKSGIKSKPSTPIGYKTLRDPPKSWNSQISKANLNKPPADPKYSDLKNVRPAKFFKMRNNMPRYLGNPASGVKPMYQVHVSPEKDKHPETTGKVEKSEIRKHSIVKIDPKTLKPISEKAPETTSLSNHSSVHQNQPNQSYGGQSMLGLNVQTDLKINTSSVSIFNPLKLQSSPKNERKSPKSPHSPKLKAQAASGGSPTGGKRDKVNLNFTPPNPFIPNLASPTMSPNQFLYPTGPPGFPPYDPRMMAAYHSLWYGQRMGFTASPIPGLSLDLNQRKNFDMMPSPPSPKVSQQGHSPQISGKMAATTSTSSAPSMSRSHPPSATSKSAATSKKTGKDAKNDKSIETTVEKLTQNRNKEISGNKGDVKVECKPKGRDKRQGEGQKGGAPAESEGRSDVAQKGADTPPVTSSASAAVDSSSSSAAKSSSSVEESSRLGALVGEADNSGSAKKSPCTTDRDKEETAAANAGASNNNNSKSNEEIVK